ncbi:hypothetical protein FOCG_17934 [Fusarium oxysporum f. sp. radicis-lycopersici 26381]|nr:hypothetical protein FOCG_17934 [Fusarium oxysporum f. sp. radicis-lycopersici 26381]
MNTPSYLGAESDKFINPLQRLAPLTNSPKVPQGQIACLFNFVSSSSKCLAEIPDEIRGLDALHIWQANRWLKDEFLDAAGNGYVMVQHYAIKTTKSPMTLWFEMKALRLMA